MNIIFLEIDRLLELEHNDNVSVLIFLRLDSAQNFFYTQVKKNIKMVINNLKVCVIRHEADYNVKNEGFSLFLNSSGKKQLSM